MKNALNLFEKKGYNNVSVEDIVNRAGVSRGSFYVHYKNKDDLLAEYIGSLEQEYMQYYETVLNKIDDPNITALHKLNMYLKYVSKALSKNGQEMLRMYNSYLVGYTDIWSKRDRVYFKVIRLLIEEASKTPGLIREDLSYHSIETMALFISRGIGIDWSVNAVEYPIEETDFVIDAFCTSIKSPDNPMVFSGSLTEVPVTHNDDNTPEDETEI